MTITVIVNEPYSDQKVLTFNSKEEVDKRFPFLENQFTQYAYDSNMDTTIKSVYDDRYFYRIIVKH